MRKNQTSSPPLLSEDGSPRKKANRLFLYAPFVLLILIALGVCGVWVVASARLQQGIETRAEALRGAGYTVELSGRQVAGFPFRIKLSYAEARLAAPSGWAVEAPGLQAEAYLHGLDHWVLVAPGGMTVKRPRGGAIAIKGEGLRASLAGLTKAPPRLVLQGTKLAFTTPPGARPFSLASADRLEFYLKPDPESPGGGRFLLRLEGGKVAPGSTLGKVAADQATAGVLEGRLKAITALHGKDWGAAVDAWRGASGEADQLHLTFTAGTVGVDSGGGALAVGRDGRLSGAMPLQLRDPAKALSVLEGAPSVEETAPSAAAAIARARTQGSTANIALVFQAGVVTLGPVKVGPSPKLD